MSPTTRRGRLAAAVAALALGAVPVATATGADAAPSRAKRPPAPVRLDLLALNDFHGNLEVPTGSSGKIFTGPGAEDFIPAGGAAYLATALDQLRSESAAAGATTLTVAAGDLIGASPLLSAAFHDEPTVETMNALGLDVTSVGNHEFDEGWRELLRMQYGGCLDDGDGARGQNSCPDGEFRGADYRYLSANVRYAKDKRTVFPASVVRRVGGVKVGFVGMTLEDTPNIVTRSSTTGLEFTDEVETVNRVVPQLKRRGVKAIVVLLHEGGVPAAGTYDYNGCPGVSGAGYDIAQSLDPAVDVVVSGHTHAAYNCTVTDPAGRPRLFTSASSFGRLVTKISLKIDRRTHDVIRPDEVATNYVVDNTTLAPRADITSLIAKYKELVAPIANEVVGQLASGLASVSRTADADGESPLGDLIADSQLTDPSVVSGGEAPVIAFMNPGGIRADLKAQPNGDVLYGDAFTVQPFNNYVTSVTLTGEQIRAVLNEQWNGKNEGVDQKILQVAGLSYTYSRQQAALPDTDALVGDVMVDSDRDGTPETVLDPAASYRVALNSFLVEGGDNFATLALGQDRFFGGLDIDALRQYLTAHAPYTPVPTDRITAVA